MRQFHVLVVDDEEPIREIVRDALEFEGYTVDLATNGAEALECISHSVPDLIFLDMHMPVMSGWEFAQELHRRDTAIPIVILTAATQPERWITEIGAIAFLKKPFDLFRLVKVVDQTRNLHEHCN